jgi:hypothetical protein
MTASKQEPVTPYLGDTLPIRWDEESAAPGSGAQTSDFEKLLAVDDFDVLMNLGVDGWMSRS